MQGQLSEQQAAQTVSVIVLGFRDPSEVAFLLVLWSVSVSLCVCVCVCLCLSFITGYYLPHAPLVP